MGEARRCHGRHSTAGDQSLSACANQGYARLTGARPCDRTAARSVTRYDARSSAISGSDREKCRRRQPSSSPATYAPTACTAPPSASRLHETNTMHCEEGARTSHTRFSAAPLEAWHEGILHEMSDDGSCHSARQRPPASCRQDEKWLHGSRGRRHRF